MNRGNSILNRLFSNSVHSIRQLAANDAEAKEVTDGIGNPIHWRLLTALPVESLLILNGIYGLLHDLADGKVTYLNESPVSQHFE